MPQRPVKMSRDEVSAFIDREFPQIHYDGRLYHIEEVGPLFRPLRRSLDNAQAGAERAATLIQQLLAFARKQSLQPVDQDINDLVQRMLDLLCAGHVQQPGGGSPLCNLMEVKHERSARAEPRGTV